MVAGSQHEWFHFLDASSDDEAVAELARWSASLKGAYDELARLCRGLVDVPDPDLHEVLGVARSTLGEGIDILDATVGRFRAGEHRVA